MGGMNNTLRLFDDAPGADGSRNVTRGGKPRIEEPQRAQGEMRFEFPEDALEPSHPARVIWNVLGKMELAAFSKGCEAVEGSAGRSLKSPRMLLTLWLYALTQAVGSAREIARLVRSDVAYRWIVGDVEISHQKLSQFRVGHGQALNELMTNILATLMSQGPLSLALVAQKGAKAGQAARQSGAGRGGRSRVHAHTTYNTNHSSQKLSAARGRCDRDGDGAAEAPLTIELAGTGLDSRRRGEGDEAIEKLEAEGADPEVIAWRERMETDEAKKLYRARAGLAELANAHQKTHHGITQVLVRGIPKVTCVILLNVIGSNLLQHANRLLGLT